MTKPPIDTATPISTPAIQSDDNGPEERWIRSGAGHAPEQRQCKRLGHGHGGRFQCGISLYCETPIARDDITNV